MNRRKFLQAGVLTTSFAFGDWQALAASPTTAGNDSPFIVNAGVGGNNTVDLLARIEKDCLAHRPDLTVLMVGTNDMNSRKHVPLPTYEQHLRRIVSMIRGVKSKVLLMTILPGYEPYVYTRHPKEFYEPEGFAERRRQVNEAIKRVARDFRQPLLDMGLLFERAGNIGEAPESLLANEANSGKKDGIHPTLHGYRTMAVAVYEFILQNRLPHNRLVCFGDSITNGGGGLDGTSYPAYLKRLLAY